MCVLGAVRDRTSYLLSPQLVIDHADVRRLWRTSSVRRHRVGGYQFRRRGDGAAGYILGLGLSLG